MPLNDKFDWSIKFLIIVVTFVRLFGQFSAESGVVCRDGDVRLAEGSSNREGIVEVCRNKEWGRVCDDFWDERDSTVVCRQLGFSEEGAMVNNMMSNTELPFVLDDVGCNGNETNLLECLPQHNCQPKETAGVRCLLNGVALEHEGGNLGNNSLVSLDNIGEGILCMTDKTLCCSEADGNWYLPDGTLLPSDTVSSNSQNLYVTREGNQTVKLNDNMNTTSVNGSQFSFGIYFCEILDRLNNLQYLYVGIYPPDKGNVTDVTIHYNKERQLIMCLSKGGPVTTVTWSLNNRTISTDEQAYENSQTIINTTSSVYESRLRIIDKTSAMAGVYRCMVSNPMGSLHAELDIQVCRDMELRINSDSNAHTTAEVCIDDQWYPIDGAVNLNDHPPRNVKVNIDANSALLRIKWQPPSGSATVDRYDTFCSTVKTDSSRYQMVKVGNLSPDINVAEMSFLLQSAVYNCCVTAHVQQPSLQLRTTSTACVSLNVPGSLVGNLCINSQYTIGFGSALGFMVLLLPIVCLVCLCITLSYKRQVRPKRKVRTLDPENMQPNPIYDCSNGASEQCGKKDDTSSPEPSASATPRYASTDDLIVTSSAKSVAENPQYGTSTGVAYYEIIDDFPTKKQKETVHLQGGKAGNTQIYYNVVAKRDDTVVYCNADVNN